MIFLRTKFFNLIVVIACFVFATEAFAQVSGDLPSGGIRASKPASGGIEATVVGRSTTVIGIGAKTRLQDIPKAKKRSTKTVAKGSAITLITVPKTGDKAKDVVINGLYGGLRAYVEIRNNEANELEKQSRISYDSFKVLKAKKLREFADMATFLMNRYMQRIASCQYQLDDSFKQDLARVLAASLAQSPTIISEARLRGQTAVFDKVVNDVFNVFDKLTTYLDSTKGQGKKSSDIALRLTIIFLQQLQNIAAQY